MQYKSLEKEESGNVETDRTGLSREDVFQLAKKWYGTEPEYPYNLCCPSIIYADRYLLGK